MLEGDSIGHFEKKKKSSYEPVSNSEWLPRQTCLNLARTFLYYSFVCADG